VVITLGTQHYTMLARNLLYTAVTHGKKLVIALPSGTSNAKRRWTKLDKWLAT
jgi:exodeoxyribonuclease V alpha subunit